MRPLGFSVFLTEVEHSRRGLSSIRHGTTWFGSSWLELAWPGLISPGLVWSGLAWPGSLFKAIVKIDYETVSRELRLATSHADYGKNRLAAAKVLSDLGDLDRTFLPLIELIKLSGD
uniref:Uncharacterized protein n=1 Tax=Vespula pensylvanica TaxID=30213 RepID=A0A834KLV5_VESPE|nr:hypothetical protein H0235_013940 [Vespula pensylvanica]